MKKFIYIIISIISIALIVFAIFKFNTNKNTNYSDNQDNVDIARTKTTTDINNTNNEKKENIKSEPKETELSHFSTDILVDDNNRDNNLELTASKINKTIIKNNETFSFNEIVGNPTEDKGYEKAGAFSNGKKIKTYGGGNCQVSTTIYDAALKVKGLKITERHEHGKEVGYVEMGKDATVAYDTLDLKFKNETGNDIKIYANVKKGKVNVKLVKLEY